MSSLQTALINLNNLPFSDAQKLAIQKRANLAATAPAYIHPDLTKYETQADARPLVVTPNPFPAYPAPGAAPTVVIQYVVPRGLVVVIRYIAVVHIGGAPPDGSGDVIWRVLINGGGIKGMENLTSQLGTYAQPNKFTIVAVEGDILQVTVEVPAGHPAQPIGDTTAARFHGFTYPLIKATYPVGGAQ